MKNAHEHQTSSLGQAPAEAKETVITHLWKSIASMVVLLIICCGAYPLVIWGISQAIFPRQANGSLVKKDGTTTTNDADAVGSSLLGQNFSPSLPGYFQPRPSEAGNGYDPTSTGGSNLGPLSDKLINGLTTSPTPPATQPAETLTFDGIRLRTIHYAVANNISFKLYSVRSDGTGDKIPVPLSQYEDSSGNLNDIALVDAFPHPATDAPDRMTLIAGDFATLIPGDAVTASASGVDPHISPANAEIQKNRIAAARGIKPDQVEALIAEHTDGPSLGIFGDPGVNVLMLNLALDAKYPIQAVASTQPSGK